MPNAAATSPAPIPNASWSTLARGVWRHQYGYCLSTNVHAAWEPERICAAKDLHRSVNRGPPTLLLLLHLEKSGGSTIKKWLLRNVMPAFPGSGKQLRRRLSAAVNYPDAPCFLCSQFGASTVNRRFLSRRRAWRRLASDKCHARRRREADGRAVTGE